MSTRRILLAISTTRYSRALVDTAVHEAELLEAAGHDVHFEVLYVIEGDELERIGKMVGDQGFLGLSPQNDVVKALGDEHHRMAMRRIEEARWAAQEKGFGIEVHEVTGRFRDVVISHAEKKHYEVILVSRADRPFISRFLFGSEADRVARLVREGNLGRVIIDDEEG